MPVCEALRDYGDRIDTIGLFSFKVGKMGVIESGVSISSMMTYIEKWPHIRWFPTVANDGGNSIFKALRDNTDGAQDTFCSNHPYYGEIPLVQRCGYRP